ncbi:hypothetical protein FHP23_010575 [Bacillus cereus]|uniref:hypothetical protein n=1 Tax=Bacillus cereus TaxID=1396 RepID=UPI00111EB604|nr:hypothetical protein [Bacillus cereus]UDW08398.1 hypothetical protein FHP23_010575 [Bacillus cereus]
MSDSSKIKLFGVDVSPTDITLGNDGSVIIKNQILSVLVNKANEKIIKDLVEDPSRALGDTGCHINLSCGAV